MDASAPTPSFPVPGAEPQQPPKKKGCLGLGCLAWLAVFGGIFLFFLLIGGILVYQSVSWVMRGPESTVANYPPLQISAGEEEDVRRVVQSWDAAKQQGAVSDEYMTPAVFNAVIERVREYEKQQGKAKANAPLHFRGGFTDDGGFNVKFTVPVESDNKSVVQYMNVEASFDLEIAEGQITTGRVKEFKLRGEPAPLLARQFINMMVWVFREKSKQPNARNADEIEGLRRIKLLKREGERLHLVLDGKEMKE
jgi:hypothetical protein